ncbi:DNA topoisomerase 2-alpha isoform X2 [Hyalella azteca]|uniref:DNA topoisomerase 2 n=1 Tax=Hyalella azteca TaxID=294128 RepID=A0A979FNE5_HYAAZ|nr:DNA topoisomerase 2-alpha isoform X2 [Hyalella azteca]
MPAVNGKITDMLMPKVDKPASDDSSNAVQAAEPAGKKRTVEKTYQKKTQLEHIILRPDTYIGSVEKVTEQMWVFDTADEKFVQREITYVPGLYKIFDEILVNAADNKQRDPKMDTIKIEIDAENNVISVYNNGHGIPVVMHKDEKMFVPTMIFGHLLTSSNYNDDEKKVTGGRNGFGAKLCNIFSTKFTVETANKEYKKNFKQTWAVNMSKASDPKIKDFTGEEYTKITFSPDLAKFGMDCLDRDTVDLLSRRAYDVAASSTGVKVYLNGKRVPVKSFKDYVELYIKDRTDDAGAPLKVVYEKPGPRWEVAVTISEKGFQHMSFVNSIATTKGGRHVDYITNMIVNSLTETLSKKNKSGVQIKNFQIKNHLWVFVNALIENPTFDSQTKENMTLQQKSFGSKCTLSDKFVAAVVKSGIVETVMAWAKFKQQAQLEKKCAGKKTSKLKGIPKLEDANDAGTRSSSECTLILTEGDSAKTLAVAGLGVVGRDKYGVFPLRGKVLNTREATVKQMMENAEINHIIQIVGLQYKKKYETVDDLKTLRYGKLMIMTDQDQDGSHIKGLIINFIHHNWPSLLRLNFLEEFITPIVKATKGKEEISFYSLPEYEEWKSNKDNWHTYKIKYYKGLGTSTSKEAKEYFSDMVRHRIKFKYEGDQDDRSIQMAFSKKAADQRKEWLTAWMLECKRRRELGLPEIYLYEKNTHSVNYSDFVNKELVLFSNADNERSIPSLVDGFKPGQRKVMFTCIKRNDKREVKVAQLAGSIAEHTAYHHGEVSLMSTIINLAQNFVGSNNINLLEPIGQFGTRLMGGKDAASPRYIFTKLSPLARALIHPHDDPLLKYLQEDNQKIEPEWYMPIIPLVLVNGAEGIGTGWSTKIPNYNPREIVDNIRKMIRGEEPKDMLPWFKNFRGTVEQLDATRYLCSGEVARLEDNQYEISELPIRTWTQSYKENVLEILQGNDKIPPIISDYREYNTDTTVRFVLNVLDNQVRHVEAEGPHKIFKLQSSMSINTMVLFDANGVLKRYNSVMDVLQEFYELRLKFYEKRKLYMVGMLKAEANKLSNQARFIKEKCEGKLVVENKKRKDMINELITKGYESDPVKAWKKSQSREAAVEDEAAEESDAEEEQTDDAADFDYLLGMPMWSLTKERKEDLLKKEQEKKHELETLQAKSESDLWNHDLDVFIEELDKVEAKEREEERVAKENLASKDKKAGGKKKKALLEVMPSPMGERIQPRIDAEMRKKAEKSAAAGAAKAGRPKKRDNPDDDHDDLDDLVSANTGKSLASRLGTSPDLVKKRKAGRPTKKNGDGLKQTKINFPKKGKNPWSSDSDADGGNSDSDLSTTNIETVPRSRAVEGKRAAAAKAKYNFSDDDEDDDDDIESLHSNDGVDERHVGPEKLSFLDQTEDNAAPDAPSPPKPAKKSNAPKPKKANAHSDEDIVISDTDSEFGDFQQKKKKPSAAASTKQAASTADGSNASDLFDSLISGSPPVAATAVTKKRTISSDSDVSESPKPAPKKKNQAEPKKKPAAKRKAFSDSDSDEDVGASKKAPTKKVSKPLKKPTQSKKKRTNEDSYNFSDDEIEEIAAPAVSRTTTGRARKPVKYALQDSDDNDDSDY